jgi:starch phosphorylase
MGGAYLRHREIQDDHVRPIDRQRVEGYGPSAAVVAWTPRARMAHLAIVGSHSVNGMAVLHTDILKQTLFRDFHALWPAKFNNKTNGVTQRRWLRKASPSLAALITSAIGDGWLRDLDQLRQLAALANDSPFLSQ